MEAPDLFRAVMISLAALLIGTVVFGAYMAWRDRFMPVPRRAPFAAVLVFVAGYVLLLVLLIVDRWNNLGKSMSPGAVIAMLALALNVVSMVMLVRSTLPDRPPEETE
jgi:drug/metabolite transporter (DMT)-like permease